MTIKKKINKPITYLLILILQVLLIISISNSLQKLYEVGIQNKGISNILMTHITTETYDKISLLMKESDFNYFDSCYKFDDKKNQYTLKDYNEKELTKIFKEVLPIHYLYYEALQTGKYENNELGISTYDNMYNILRGSSEAQRNKYLTIPRQNISKFSDDQITELCIKDVQLEYKKLGYNTEKIETNYIIKCLIKISLATTLLIIISLFSLEIRKKYREYLDYLDILQNIILMIILTNTLLKYKLLFNIILFSILLLIILSLILLNRLRITKDKLNIYLSMLEDKLNIFKILNKIYKFRWTYLIIILFFVNCFIYYGFSTYHLYVGMNPTSLYKKILFISTLTLEMIVYFNLLVFLIRYYTLKRPIIKKDNQRKIILENNISSKKKKKKKKK